MFHVLVVQYDFFTNGSEHCAQLWRGDGKLTLGFIVLICSLVGVPRTLMISTNWSMPDSPGKRGCPSISSAMTQPVDQISTVSARVLLSNTD